MSAVPSGATGSVRVRHLRVSGRAVVVKSGTGRARRDLRAEAAVLRHLDAAPVPRLVALRESDDRTDLVTDDVGGEDLAQLSPRTPDEVLSILAAAARSVAALHDTGWTHGAICAEHLVLDRRGDVVLCSMASARPALDADRRRDDAALAEAILGALARPGQGWTVSQRLRWRRAVRRLQRDLDAGPGNHLPVRAAHVAELIGHQVSRTPARQGAPRPHPPSLPIQVPTLSRPTLRLVGSALAVAVAALAWGATDADAGDRERSSPPAATTEARGEPVHVVAAHDNQLVLDGTTYRAGAAGDVIVVAPLACGAPSSVLLLRPSTGEIFRFAALPDRGRPIAAALVAEVAGATALGTATEPCARAVARVAGRWVAPVATDSHDQLDDGSDEP